MAGGGTQATADRPAGVRGRDPARGATRRGLRGLIVLDASAGIELAVATRTGVALQELLREEAVVVPAHFDVEVLSGIRRYVRRRMLMLERARLALRLAVRLPSERVPLAPMIEEAFELRDRFSAHDAMYAVLAHRRGLPLVTADPRFARAASGYVEVLSPSST